MHVNIAGCGSAYLPGPSLHNLLSNRFLRGVGKDLSVFDLFIQMPQELWIRQTFGRPLPRQLQSKWLARHNYLGLSSPSGTYRVVLKVARMGDLNTVNVWTAVHAAILRRAGVLRLYNQLRYGLPLRSSRELVSRRLHR